MNNDNSDGDEPEFTGRSVFGDDELPTGASVFGDAEDLPSASASVFGDLEPELPVDEVPAEAIESPSTSVFGDSPGTDLGADESPVLRSATLDDWSTPSDDSGNSLDLGDSVDATEIIHPDADGLSEAVPSVVESSVFDSTVPLDDGSDDPIDLLGDPVTSIPDDPAESSTSDFSDDITRGEAIALDVEPGDEDGLGAWSDLGSTAPAWGDEEEAGESAETQSWDPGPLPEAEPQVVKIGGESERFFEFDDNSPDGVAAAAQEMSSGGSELQSRIVTGVALLAIALVAINLGPLVALGLIVVVVALASGEFYNALRVAGYQPATLLGLTASVAMPIAVYFRGTQAVALILALTVVFGLLWYLAGVASEMPVMNLGVTLLGVVYIGILGSFGAALLETAERVQLNGDDGTGLLLAAVLLTVGYDVGAFFSGRSMGRTPLTSVSPNKTVEGLVGGAIMTVVASIVFLSVITFIEPFGTFGSPLDAAILGVAAAIMAPLGDLGESLLKRDLGIKDMGSILPGHGGFLDRFDALLFVLPTVYFFALAVFY